jgi:hypothetical protein
LVPKAASAKAVFTRRFRICRWCFLKRVQINSMIINAIHERYDCFVNENLIFVSDRKFVNFFESTYKNQMFDEYKFLLYKRQRMLIEHIIMINE